MPRVLLLLAVAAVGIGLLSVFQGPAADLPPATYVPRGECIECHADQHATWEGSHHDLGMDHATEASVLGDFDDASFTNHGITSRFFKKDGAFFVNTEGPDGKLHDYEILYTIGYEPLQQYLIDVGDGRLQCLQVSWDTEKKRWFHIQPDRITPDDRLHWTSMQFNANFMCIECHVTGYDRAYKPETNGYASTWHDIDVGCQACHGPGSNHVAWARDGGDDPAMGLEVRLKSPDPLVQIDGCARCHARRVHVSDVHGHGEPLLDHMAARLLVEPLYHADGQILDEVYVYGSFVQTKKFHKGVRCTDCHDAHSAALKHEGDALCMQCHQENPPERFPTLRRMRYDTPEHHFHTPGTPGSHCVDCHMPAKTYMGVDPRRDHSFRVPRPDLTMKIGTPNACNGCHEDQDARWAVEEIAKRHPSFVRGRVESGHWGIVLDAARRNEPKAFGPLARLASEQSEPAIVRATAVHYLQRYEPSEAVRAIAPALVDESGLVRATAAAAIGRLVPEEAPAGLQQQKVHVLEPLLDDPLRHVRGETARAIAGAAETHIPAGRKAAFEQAITEWIDTQRAIEDRPAAHLNLGALYEIRRQPRKAEAAYRRAMLLDPKFLPVRFNLATLLAARGQLTEADQVLTVVTELAPEGGEGWYSLGLLRAERKDMEGAATALARAVKLMPERGRVRFNYALVLQELGDAERSLAELRIAQRKAPDDVRILDTLIRMHVTREEWDIAEALAEKLKTLRPNDPGVSALLEQFRERREGKER